MSRAAQEMQRAVDGLKREQKTSRRTAMAENSDLGLEPEGPEGRGEYEVGGIAGTAASDGGAVNNSAEAGAADMAKKTATRRGGKKKATTEAKPRARAAKPAKTEKAPKAPKAPKAATPEKVRDVMAGVRANPKNKILFINSKEAMDFVYKALKAALKGEVTPEEKFHGERLMARIEARI
jgi:hypothetical protein